MRRYSNTAVATTLTSAIDATQTTIPLAAVTGWPLPTGGDVALAQIDAELVAYTGITALDLTGCTRGVDGTTAAAHASGAAVAHVGSAADLELIHTHAAVAATDTILGHVRIWQGTQAEYDALTPAADVLYLVVA